MEKIRIIPTKLQGIVLAPSSKSMGHREIICAGLAEGTSVVPFFFIGVYEKDGYPAEQLFYFMIRQKFLLPGIRPYIQENIFLQTVVEEKIENKEKKKFFVFWNTPSDNKKSPNKKNRKKLIPDTAQKTIGFQRMYQDGICKVSLGYYTKMMQFWDINYELLSEDERRTILSL